MALVAETLNSVAKRHRNLPHEQMHIPRKRVQIQSGKAKGEWKSVPLHQHPCYLCKQGWCRRIGKKGHSGGSFCNRGRRPRRSSVMCNHPDCQIGGQPIYLCTLKHKGCGCFDLWHNREHTIKAIDYCPTVD